MFLSRRPTRRCKARDNDGLFFVRRKIRLTSVITSARSGTQRRDAYDTLVPLAPFYIGSKRGNP